MKTAEQRKEEFMQELHQLCYKHKCEMSLSDDGKGYGFHSPIIVLAFESVYSKDSELLNECGVFELDGLYIPSEEGK
jgi:hypothetical protein